MASLEMQAHTHSPNALASIPHFFLLSMLENPSGAA